jgi:serine/threonine-protein kinase
MSTQPDQWQVLSPYLDRALTLSEEERAHWLEALRAQDPVLANQLQALLDEHGAAEQEGFLQNRPMLPLGSAGLAGQTVSLYRLASPIGQGGMGTVWLAERSDGRFERRVAVKFLNIALLGRGGEERFKREGAILGRLSHPHIAELLDAGVSPTGQPYLVLEHVEGEPIDCYCDQRKLDIAVRVRLFQDVLEAVAHAHANLIVHRDIKPSNVLVNKDGQVKLLDFGIAKLLEGEGQEGAATLLTREAGAALTPEYAAPEQVTGAPVTTATDVYGLGVLFYVLLTGQHPAGPGPHSPAELLRAITETDPPRPSEVVASTADQAADRAANRGTLADKLRRQLRGDLDTIVAKVLKKNSQERYASVTALAEDLSRYFRSEPLSARPDTLAYRAAKFARRNRTAVALATVAAVAMAAGVIGTLFQSRTARIQRDLARTQRDFAFRQLSRAEAINDLNTFLLADAAPSGKPFTSRELLQRAERIIEQQHAPNDLDRVRLMVSIGNQYLMLDDEHSAVRVLEEAYRLSRVFPDPSVRAAASCTLAALLSRSQDLVRAEKLFQEGLGELPKGPEFTLERVNCLSYGGDVAEASGNIQEGIERAEAAAAVLRQSPFDSDAQELRLWTSLGDAYSSAGQAGKALAAFERSSRLVTSLGRDDTVTAAALFNNYGLLLYQTGRTLEANKLYWRAIEINTLNQSQDSVSPVMLCNYAKSLLELGRLDEAAAYAEKGYELAQRLGPHSAINHLLTVRARIYTKQHKPDRAAAMLAEVESLLRKDLPPGHVAFAILALDHARLESEKGNIPAATAFAEQAVSINEAAIKAGKEGNYSLPKVLLGRSAVELEAKRFDQAAADASRALDLQQRSLPAETFSGDVGLAYLALGRALQAQGKNDEARRAFRSAAQQLEPAVGFDHPDTRVARQLAGLEPSQP